MASERDNTAKAVLEHPAFAARPQPPLGRQPMRWDNWGYMSFPTNGGREEGAA